MSGKMNFVGCSLILVLAFLANACGTSSSTVTGPSLDRCSIAVANSVSSVGAAGGNGRVSVTAGRECTWSVTSNVAWITLASPASGQGDGGVGFVVAANPDSDIRRGVMEVGGQRLEVTQEAAPCAFEMQPTSQNVGAEGGNGSFNVAAASGCSWTPTASDEWITIAEGGSRSGNGTVSFSISSNSGGTRQGTISVAGRTFTIFQAAPGCRYLLSAAGESFAGAGGSGTVNVAAASACTWTATSNASWIAITGGATDNGNGVVSYSVQSNTGAARNGTLTIAGQTFTVTQLQAACNYSIAPASQPFTSAGGQGNVTISTNSICTWNTSGVPSWITGVPADGTGAQTITFIVAANTGIARSANMIIGGQTFTVSQAVGCSYLLNPTSHSAPSGGGPSSLNVNTAAGCGWTSSGAPTWVTGVPASGAGPQTISFTVAANTGVARSANIIVGGQTFAISQAGGCTYSLNPSSHSAPVGGGPSSFGLNTAAGCGWTTSGVPSWITGVPANGTGPQTINFTVAANAGVARSANITAGGQTFAVSQTSGCSSSLNPTSHSAPAGGGPSSFAVNTPAGCGWTSSGVPSWITGVPASGTGPQAINFSVSANTGVARSANIIVGGDTFAVSQASGCSSSLNPTSHSAPAGGGPSSFAVNTAAGCGWTSSGVPSWITGVPASGTGPQTINFSVSANTGAARSANIIVGGDTFAVSQAAGCSFSLNPNSHSAPAGGGASSFDVDTTAGCDWTSSGVPSWVTGVPGSGTGPQTINFTVAANTGGARNANITVAGRTFAVSQAAGCNYSLSPNSHSATSGGGPSSVEITTSAGCEWTSSGVPSWVAGVPANGTGTQNINFTVSANTGPARNANFTIGGQTFAVSQTNGCTYSVSPGTLTFDASGSPSKDITVTTAAGCAWSATPSDSWINVVSGGSGPGSGTIKIQLQTHSGPGSRSGSVTAGGDTVNITQTFP